jgi:VanZ family protein
MFFKYNIPGILWAIIILILLGLPGSDLPDASFINIPQFDKLVHAGLFGILVFLLARGFYLQHRFDNLTKHFIQFSFLISVFYGGLTEILQGRVFPDRTSDIFDFISDVAGSAIAIVLFLLYKKKVLSAKIADKIPEKN